MIPETRYAKGPDGLIAYQIIGDGPPDLVYLTGATSHVDGRWESPAYAHFHRRLASFSRLILFDRRGVGASDPVALEALPTWEEWSEDLTVVMDAAGSERAAIFAMIDGSAMAIPFTASHPDRTSALILGNATARWRKSEDYPQGLDTETAESILRLIASGWGTEGLAIVSQPGLADNAQERAWFAKYMRACASPTVADALLRSAGEVDLRQILPSISVPTLILHRREFELIPIDQGRYLAEHIQGARLIELGGSDGNFVYADSDTVAGAIEEFLTGVRPMPDPDRVLATVLITDLVDSTRQASDHGDRKWAELLNRHDDISRNLIEDHRGRVWKMTGDGVLATFDAPGRAIRCALNLHESLGRVGLSLRAGLHSGEIELRAGDIGGIAVNLAARVTALAGPGEVLVSRTVADLVAGSGIRFEGRGTFGLKGIPGDWQLFSVGPDSGN
ncbi:MAG: adenylate/guanylate cyclase domain-containing protein [Actinobacteria bacterium]|nr:adenylate/guanylate cyclase domain-containing protein [Actinomycetota bacterium]